MGTPTPPHTPVKKSWGKATKCEVAADHFIRNSAFLPDPKSPHLGGHFFISRLYCFLQRSSVPPLSGRFSQARAGEGGLIHCIPISYTYIVYPILYLHLISLSYIYILYLYPIHILYLYPISIRFIYILYLYPLLIYFIYISYIYILPRHPIDIYLLSISSIYIPYAYYRYIYFIHLLHLYPSSRLYILYPYLSSICISMATVRVRGRWECRFGHLGGLGGLAPSGGFFRLSSDWNAKG